MNVVRWLATQQVALLGSIALQNVFNIKFTWNGSGDVDKWKWGCAQVRVSYAVISQPPCCLSLGSGPAACPSGSP